MRCRTCKRPFVPAEREGMGDSLWQGVVVVEGTGQCEGCYEHKCETCAAFVLPGASRCVACVELSATKGVKAPEIPDFKKGRLVNTYVGNCLDYNTTEEEASSDRRTLATIEREREQDHLDGTFRGSRVDYCPDCRVALPATGRCDDCE